MPTTSPPPEKVVKSRVMPATLMGNFMEWFDFAVYGFFAPTIGAVFFASEDETTSLLASLAVFGVAFFFRPLGGLFFGTLGDRAGRRTALSTAILLMTVSTVLIAVLPTYAAVGILAPVLLVVLRAVQGLSVGGEWTGASTFLVEYAPQRRRGLYASFISATAGVGFASGSLIALGLNSWLTPEQLQSWGWRLPFLVAAPLGIVGLYMRLKLEDTPVFQDLRREHRVASSPLQQTRRNNGKELALAFACAGITGLGLYYLATYMVNYLSETVGFERTEAIVISAGGLLVYVALCPLAGLISDRIGRRPTYIVGCFGHVLLVVPVFLLLGSEVALVAFLALCVFGVFQAALNVMSSVVIAELFPAENRLTGASIGHNLGLAIVSGTGPFVAAWLVSRTGSDLAPGIYLGVLALVAGVVLLRWLPETYGRDLGRAVGAVDEDPAAATAAGPAVATRAVAR